jgi:hypothetical protein
MEMKSKDTHGSMKYDTEQVNESKLKMKSSESMKISLDSES